MRATPPAARMSAGTRSSAITAAAPASSAIRACSALTTSMITPPLSISARPALTRNVPVSIGYQDNRAPTAPPGVSDAHRARSYSGRPSRRHSRGVAARVNERPAAQELRDLRGSGRLEAGKGVRIDPRSGGRCHDRRRRRAEAPAPRADVVDHQCAAAPGVARHPHDAVEGRRSRLRPGSSAGGRRRAPITRASTSVATLATWWSPNASAGAPCAWACRAADRSSCARRSRWPRRGPTASGSSRRTGPLDPGRVVVRHLVEARMRAAREQQAELIAGTYSAERSRSGATAVSAPPRMPPGCRPRRTSGGVSILPPELGVREALAGCTIRRARGR